VSKWREGVWDRKGAGVPHKQAGNGEIQKDMGRNEKEAKGFRWGGRSNEGESNDLAKGNMFCQFQFIVTFTL